MSSANSTRRGYHLTSLLLQVANAVVLYVLTVALLVRCRTDSCLESPWTCSLSAGLATALFAVHPLRVEAVAWASCQPYPPCAFLDAGGSRLSPCISDGFSPRGGVGWRARSSCSWRPCCSMRCAVSLPAVLLILDVYPLRRFRDGPGRWFGRRRRRALLEKIPFVMASLVFMGLAIAAKPRSRFPVQHDDASKALPRRATAIWFYIVKTVFPLDLIAFYPLPRERELARTPIQFEHPRHAGDLRRLVSPAPALARTLGGLAELPGDPGAQLGLHSDQRSDRRGSL